MDSFYWLQGCQRIWHWNDLSVICRTVEGHVSEAMQYRTLDRSHEIWAAQFWN
jgi:hypothetical protein